MQTCRRIEAFSTDEFRLSSGTIVRMIVTRISDCGFDMPTQYGSHVATVTRLSVPLCMHVSQN